MKRTASLIATIIILVFVVVCKPQNSEFIEVDFLFWNFESSLALALLITFSLAIIAALLSLLPAMTDKKMTKTVDQTD